MRKGSSKKTAERRKKARSRTSPKKAQPAGEHSVSSRRQAQNRAAEEACHHCSGDLINSDRALFVEEEIGRTFCSEECITAYFSPEIERLEKDYFKHLSSNDLNADEREKLAHLRWITLQEPDEIWREKTLAGDHRFTLISEFHPGSKPIWCVCICLFLRGEPSFLYLAFPTKNAAMVNQYRRGERVQWAKPKKGAGPHKKKDTDIERPDRVEPEEEAAAKTGPLVDGLADAWTEDETLRAQLSRERRVDDIPSEEFSLYQTCLDETLENPDEVWTLRMNEEGAMRLYHFIRHYPDDKPGVWFVIVARETEDEEQIEILDAFPTKDPELVENYRRGDQEIGSRETQATSRLVH